jgi:hypothetical protein
VKEANQEKKEAEYIFLSDAISSVGSVGAGVPV